MVIYEINNLTRYRLPRQLIAKVFQVFNQEVKLKSRRSVSLAFISAVQIRQANRCYRGRDKVTDVLSFTAGGPGEIDDSLGEILICPQRASQQGKEYGWTFSRELARLLIHGLAHLLGYDHENVSAKKAREMERFEAKILDKLGK